eukprot:TRINITY_DN11105_c0_g1_i1.p1 TRINITY_DN11105_c0_g1~~TRINITY_DN11105_c0_g1_i1.p1  ORF type:complete len:216 (+),score=16.85 TRINITY_DN11105_c0_g1_i1:161-808(+)
MVRVRKVALMGFPAVGKSSLAFQYVENKFEAEYVTTIQDQFEKRIKIGDRDFKLEIYDTMGVTELPNFPDDYLIMDGWVIVYSVTEERSFDVVREIYDRLMASGSLRPPLVIVANKCDLAEDRYVHRDICSHAPDEASSNCRTTWTDSSSLYIHFSQLLFCSVISEAQGRDLAKECGAIYIEASARDNVVRLLLDVQLSFHQLCSPSILMTNDPT